ncbi:MAG: hypothetical protein Q4F17_08675 [Eubacteriales bacterium]|nr:hypothetical protein [Eubacteriales bacterium]
MQINKGVLRGVLYVYIAAMLALVFCSKTIYNRSIPAVTAVMPSPGTLALEITGTGILEDGVLKITVPEAQGRAAALGDGAVVTAGATGITAQAQVTDMTAQNGTITLTLTCGAAEIPSGEAVSVSLKKTSREYQTLLPNEAVSREPNGNYVWLVRSKDGPLGTEYYTVRRKVFIDGFDSTKTAVTAGLDFPEPVITSTTHPLTDGGRVKRAE